MIISYNWLKYYIKDIPAPDKIADVLTFHLCEIEEVKNLPNGDTIFDVKVLPDRAHDCLSHFGVAKEVGAIFNLKLKEKKYKSWDPKNTDLQIEIQSPNCLRYMGRIIKNVKVGPSPIWLREKLESIGQKSINNIVDIANFVMYDLGQPIHCFDLDKLASHKIIVRNGKQGEKIKTLDKRDIELDDSILVIADDIDPLAIAGIKGGTKAEVDMNTKNILIEVANFEAISTRRTSRKVGILTDAVKRYENEITPELCGEVMDMVTDMIMDIASGQVEDIVDVYPKKPELRKILTSIPYINKRLGADFTKEDITEALSRLGFSFEEEGDDLKVIVPFLRLDITGGHDLVEEVGRIIGYDKLIGRLPEINLESKVNDMFSKMILARNKLLNDGYSEVMTYTFCDRGEVEVLASASDKNFLRNNLTDGLVESLKLNTLNLPLLDVDEVKIFEIGTVFKKDKEEMRVAYGDKKGITEMTLEGYISSPEFHSENTNISSQDTSLETFLPQVFKPWSIYPFMTRDIAVWVPEGTKPKILSDIYKELGTELLVKEPKLFDQFTKDGKTSYAYRLVFQSYQRTLVEDEVNTIMENITKKIISLGFTPR